MLLTIQSANHIIIHKEAGNSLKVTLPAMMIVGVLVVAKGVSPPNSRRSGSRKLNVY